MQILAKPEHGQPRAQQSRAWRAEAGGVQLQVVRAYEAADLAAVLAVWELAARQAHPFVPEAWMVQERSDTGRLYLPSASTWVLERDGVVAGFIALIGQEVGGLFIRPDQQGQGLGSVLLNKAKALHGTLVLKVFVRNDRACHFYQHHGFVPGGLSWHAPTSQPLLCMRWSER